MIDVDVLFSVSDLHIGGAPDFRIFDDGDALASLVDVARGHAAARVVFVLNGDVFDFLAADHSVPFSPENALVHLTTVLLPDPRFAKLWAALRAFTAAPGRILVVNTGNHDIELGDARVQAAVNAALQAPGARIVWHTHQEGFTCTVAGRRVVVVHGNDTDVWNRVDPGYVDRPDDPAPNAGSMLVTTVMNRVKRRFRWLDVLKPEGIHLAALALALDDDPTDPLLNADEAKALTAVLARRAKDSREGGFELAVEDDAVELAVDVEGRWKIPLMPFKWILKDLLNARLFWSEAQRDDQWQALAAKDTWQGVDLLIAGHTHAPRQGPLRPDGPAAKTTYINTATWAFIMTLSDADFSDAGFPAIDAVLRTRGDAGFNTLLAQQRLVRPRRYAYVDADVATLRTHQP